MISTAELILLRLYPFLTLWLKMESGFCHFSFPSDCGSSGTLQGFALWTLGLCLLAKAFVLGAVWSLPGVSRLLTRIGLDWANRPASAAVSGLTCCTVSDWCPHRGSRTAPGDLTSTSKASQGARPNGRSSLGIRPRDTSEAFCGRGPLTPCTGTSVQVSGLMGGSGHESPPAQSDVRTCFLLMPETPGFKVQLCKVHKPPSQPMPFTCLDICRRKPPEY